jgi:hypothetical protein
MKPANKKFLDDNRHHHTTLIKAQYLRHLNANEREGMQRVMREEFQPGYSADLWCPPCCAEMVRMLYRLYDDWLATNPDPPTEPLKVAASFPSNVPRGPADTFTDQKGLVNPHKNHHRK